MKSLARRVIDADVTLHYIYVRFDYFCLGLAELYFCCLQLVQPARVTASGQWKPFTPMCPINYICVESGPVKADAPTKLMCPFTMYECFSHPFVRVCLTLFLPSATD
jgi:hypothetical protein